MIELIQSIIMLIVMAFSLAGILKIVEFIIDRIDKNKDVRTNKNRNSGGQAMSKNDIFAVVWFIYAILILYTKDQNKVLYFCTGLIISTIYATAQ